MTLPQGWALARVDELAGANGVVTDGDWVESRDQDVAGEVRLTQLADVGEGDFRDRSSRYMNRETAERLRCTFLQPGDTLIARMPDPIGRACLFPGLKQPAVTAVDVMVWRTDGELADANWFVRWVNSPTVRTLMAEGAGGTTRQRIAGGKIKELELPVPPKAEQRRIVAKLDVLIARLARTRAELDRVPVLAAKLRREALGDAFRCDARGTIKLGDVVDDVRYGTAQKCDYGLGGTPVLRIPNVQRGRIDLSDIKSADFGPKEVAKLALRPGDVLVIRSNGSLDLVGTSAVVGAEADGILYAGYLIRLRPSTKKVDPRFVHHFLQSPVARELIAGGARSTSGVNNVNAQQLQSLPISVRDLSEQQEIVENLDAAFARADRFEAETTRARALIDRLEAAILARAFRGELVPQDPADEPASVLLDRIRAQRAAAPKPKRGRRASAAA